MPSLPRPSTVHTLDPQRPTVNAASPSDSRDGRAGTAEQATDEWKQRYAVRAGVEGTIHQAVTTTGIRRSRYLGLPKTHLAHVFTAVAINLIRLDAYWTGTTPGRTCTSHLTKLSLTLAA
jgi:hypothetical protein